jgi:hypothetical protein
MREGAGNVLAVEVEAVCTACRKLRTDTAINLSVHCRVHLLADSNLRV